MHSARLGRFSLVALALVVASCAPAFVAPQEVRDAVAARAAQGGLDVDAAMRAKGLFATADLTSQAAPDIIVDYSAAPSQRYCGTGGCPLQVWVKIGAAPYRLAFDIQALGHSIETGANRTWLATQLHGVHCGRTGADACAYAFEWSGAADQPGGFHAASIFGKPDHYVGPLMQALPFDLEAAPIEISSTVERFESACAKMRGGGDASGAVSTVPDLNEDGRREVVFDGRFAACLAENAPRTPVCHADTCGTIVFAAPSTPGGAWSKIYSSTSAQDYDFDFSSGKPRMRIIEPCETERCQRRSLVWFPDEGRLK
ncbi:MAG: Uncharacterized protein FD124_3002 [Alphaproteobacteria bacterium]|nr:MAG: Uncharacterized protein FD160_2219 [Caulobacteraceae bacterium]TPW03467.1 MAG: Uncharacterized protein FD124_3002 [Alphaproteobacteria bacterium]